jgi:hypothetical protein
MLEAVARIAGTFKRQSQVSVERVMGCGMGGCYSCVIPVRDGWTGHYYALVPRRPGFDGATSCGSDVVAFGSWALGVGR